MRKWNASLSALLIVIFMIHSVRGSFLMLGVGRTVGKTLAWTGCGLLVVHIIFGALLTARTLKSGKTSGKWYFRQNAAFWARRISGLCILALAFFHFRLFGRATESGYVLFDFTTARLLVQLLFTAALFVHIFINIRPLLLSFGVLKYRERRIDCFLVLSAILLFCAGATMIYYLRD
jgi:succinate dehydrogenase/fumarate reductase cytochrome b subunit